MTAPDNQPAHSRAFMKRVLLSGWLPFIVGLLSLVSLLFIRSAWLPRIFIPTLLGSIFYFFSATIFWAFKKRWRMMAISFGATFVLATPLLVIVFLAAQAMSSMFGPSEDGFADNLSLPTDVELAEPTEFPRAHNFKSDAQQENQIDPFQATLMTALETAANGDSTVTANVANLEFLAKEHPALLSSYLAARPEWRVFQERGRQYATRRWKLNGEWQYELHGYYSDFDIGRGIAPERFQSRFTIGLDGKPWAKIRSNATQLASGETKVLTLGNGNSIDESHCVITAGPVVLEVFEQSIGKERRLTKAAINLFEAELAPLAKSPTRETLQTLVPDEETRSGDPDLLLSNSFQGGIYDGEVWCNPGGPGIIYLRAYEITTGKRLSESRLQEYSSERVNWSDDVNELFMARTHFTIYEGDWDQYYGARFEVWFIPDTGNPERKLFEKNYKIQGWMR